MKYFYIFMAIFSAIGVIFPPLDIFTVLNGAFFCYWVYRVYEIKATA